MKKLDTIECVKRVMEINRDEAKKAIAKEKKHVNINPESYVAKEIEYQTALLQEIRNRIIDLSSEVERMKRTQTSIDGKYSLTIEKKVV